VERVLGTLGALLQRQQSQGSDAIPPSEWNILLDTAASLLDGSPPAGLCELTRIALGCGAHEMALDLAKRALRVVDRESVLECRALRLLGAAMLRSGIASGAGAIQDALTLAITQGANLEAAEALNELGLHELRLGERAAAESRLRAAVALCPSGAELWTPLRDRLAQSPAT